MGFALRASLRLFHFATTDILSFVLRTRLRRLRFALSKTFPAKWSPDFAFSRTRLSDNNSLLSESVIAIADRTNADVMLSCVRARWLS